MRLAVVLCALFAVTTAYAVPDTKAPSTGAEKHKDKKKDPQPPVDPTPPKAAPPPPGPEDAHAKAGLDKLVAATAPAARTAAIDELTKLAPKAIDAIGAFLLRTHD